MFRHNRRQMITGTWIVAALAATASATTNYLGPTPYLSLADSPLNGPAFSWFHLENFEDRSLNSPGLSASAGGLIPASPDPLTDSVDGDDGAIDGSGNGGNSWYSFGASSLTFTFNAGVLGNYPTHAGVVWTDVGSTTLGAPGIGQVVFEAFDPGGNSLGVLGPFTLGDGSAAGGTAEDRFFGLIATGGVSAIRIAMLDSTDWEVDHVQYGYVPEPLTLALLLGGLTLVTRRRTLP